MLKLTKKPFIPFVVLAFLFISIFLTSKLSAHTFQTNLYPDIELKKDHLVIELWVATFLFPPLEDINYGDNKPRPTLDKSREQIESFFNTNCPVYINGKKVPPNTQWLKFEEMEEVSHLGENADLTMAKMLFHYPASEEVRNIKFGWGLWFTDQAIKVETENGEETISHNPNILDMLIFVGGEAHPMYLTKEEPEFTWHAPARIITDNVEITSIEPIKKVNAGIPIISICVLVIGFFLTITRQRGKTFLRLSIIISSFIVAFILRNTLVIETSRSSETLAKNLDSSSAADLFTKLHRSIYRAFESDSEDAIYNNLAKSVSQKLIGPLYEEVYQSLILRDEGGAISRINRVDYIEVNAIRIENSDDFKIYCKWQVHGNVRHWGHSHKRSNEYEADYTLSVENDLWKIASSSVNLQKRVTSPNGK